MKSNQEQKWVQDALRGHSASKIARKSKVSPQRVARALARLGLVNRGSVAYPEWVMAGKKTAKPAKKVAKAAKLAKVILVGKGEAKAAKSAKRSKTKKAPRRVPTIAKTVKKAAAKRVPQTKVSNGNGHSSDRVIIYRVDGLDILERCAKIDLSKRLIDLTLAGRSPQLYAPLGHRLAVEFG